MPWVIAGIAGLFGFGYVADKTGKAADSAARLVAVGAVAGGVWLVYQSKKGGR
jgi:ABC-type Mn2+/Zn2+ transport system permease subunit